jgi:hypothetical protein
MFGKADTAARRIQLDGRGFDRPVCTIASVGAGGEPAAMRLRSCDIVPRRKVPLPGVRRRQDLFSSNDPCRHKARTKHSPNLEVNMKFCFRMLLPLVLVGCATVTPIVMPDGRRGMSIDCTGESSWAGCYQKAGQMCPAGYEVISKDGDVGNKVAVGTRDGFSSSQIASRAMLVVCMG